MAAGRVLWVSHWQGDVLHQRFIDTLIRSYPLRSHLCSPLLKRFCDVHSDASAPHRISIWLRMPA